MFVKFTHLCFSGSGTSATPSTPSWWCSSGACSSPAPRWPGTSGTLWWASASSSSPTSEPPPPWDSEPGGAAAAAKAAGEVEGRRREENPGAQPVEWFHPVFPPSLWRLTGSITTPRTQMEPLDEPLISQIISSEDLSHMSQTNSTWTSLRIGSTLSGPVHIHTLVPALLRSTSCNPAPCPLRARLAATWSSALDDALLPEASAGFQSVQMLLCCRFLL